MTQAFEKIVRPAQLGDISPVTVQIAASGTTSDNVTLKYGGNGSAKVMFGSTTQDVTFYAVKKMREQPKTV